MQVETFDRVLIDGRARAACATYILRHLTPDSVVFIHDYVTRTRYHSVVEQHYTPARCPALPVPVCMDELLCHLKAAAMFLSPLCCCVDQHIAHRQIR